VRRRIIVGGGTFTVQENLVGGGTLTVQENLVGGGTLTVHKENLVGGGTLTDHKENIGKMGPYEIGVGVVFVGSWLGLVLGAGLGAGDITW
jgi:hypothetical protein